MLKIEIMTTIIDKKVKLISKLIDNILKLGDIN